MLTRTHEGATASLATSFPNGKRGAARRVAALCSRLWHDVPMVGIDFLIGVAVFAMIRIPVAEFGNTFNRIVTRQVPTSVLDSGAYWSAATIVQAASFVVIGWLIGGLSPRRRARALVGAIS